MVQVFVYVFLLLNVVYLAICAKLVFFVGMTKHMSNGKEADTVNRQPRKSFDLTSFRRHDFPRVNDPLHLSPYHLTFV